MAEKKKILYVVEAMGGGVFTYIVELANALSDEYEVYIAYATRKQTPQNYKEYFKDNVHLIEVKNFTRSVKSTQDLKAFFEIKKIARKIRPDIIHLHSSKAIYIDNGINTKNLQKMLVKVDREENKKFTVFTLGRICYQKNPKLFNEVAKKLPDVRFVWIGDGELREELTADNIEITGWVNRRKALSYAVSANAFVLTSLWEGLPMSLLEAMYMEKLCVVSNVIGNRDVIKNSKNGFVCNNADEFAEKIKYIESNDCSVMIENAKKDVMERYNTAVMAEKYDKIYRLRLERRT